MKLRNILSKYKWSALKNIYLPSIPASILDLFNQHLIVYAKGADQGIRILSLLVSFASHTTLFSIKRVVEIGVVLLLITYISTACCTAIVKQSHVPNASIRQNYKTSYNFMVASIEGGTPVELFLTRNDMYVRLITWPI